MLKIPVRSFLLLAVLLFGTNSFPLEENGNEDEGFLIDLESLGSDLYGERDPAVGGQF